MAETTRDQSQSRQAAQPAVEAAAKSPAREQPKSAFETGAAGTVASRRGQYLVGSRLLPGLAPIPTELIVQKLSEMEGVEIVRRLCPHGPAAASNGTMTSASEIVIVRMEEARREELHRIAAPNLVIEPDGFLHYGDAIFPAATQFHVNGQVMPAPGRGREIRFRVVGDGDRPQEGASISVFGSGFPAQAVTDASGQATVTFYDEHNDAPGGLGAVKAVYVRPASDHWERFIPNPAFGDGVNLISLRPLNQTFSNFPAQRLIGWGQRMMKLDLLSDGLDGGGVKIGLIDSGCDHTHPLLRHVTQGIEVVDPARPSGWTIDPTGHGTHCAGIIAAGDRSLRQGILGFAPNAELHVLKVLPGGRCSDLIAALDECIAQQLDIVNIGVGIEQNSELLALKLAEARQKGVACVVAAGASGAPTPFQGFAPRALEVSAVGKLGEFPLDTHHAQTALRQPMGAEGLFTPRFSSYASPAAVCAPGVAIVSTVPGGGYAARDGAAMAAAHITGFAAVLLAHSPIFQGPYRTRGEQRVGALFEIVRASRDPSRLGAALPAWTTFAPQTGQGVPATSPGGSGFMSALSQALHQASPGGRRPPISPLLL